LADFKIDTFIIVKTIHMLLLTLPLYSWENGAFIMTVIFGLVIIGIIAGVYLMMNNDSSKKRDNH